MAAGDRHLALSKARKHQAVSTAKAQSLPNPAHPAGPGHGRSAEPHPFPAPRSLVLAPSAGAKQHSHVMPPHMLLREEFIAFRGVHSEIMREVPFGQSSSVSLSNKFAAVCSGRLTSLALRMGICEVLGVCAGNEGPPCMPFSRTIAGAIRNDICRCNWQGNVHQVTTHHAPPVVQCTSIHLLLCNVHQFTTCC
eukprot:1157371-Pelagomonas_calceolata.AAC.1